MAETSLLFKNGPLSIDDITLDAVVSENHTSALQVTEHPVEAGANISDHARQMPDVVTLDIALSNTTKLGEHTPGRAIDIYEKLRLLQTNAELVTVVTTLRVYENMILENLSVPRTVKDAGGLRCTASLRQVRVVQNKTSIVEVTREPIAKKKVSDGKKAAKNAVDGAQKEAEVKAEVERSSYLYNWFGSKK